MKYLWGICVKPNTQERFYKPGSDSVEEIGIYDPPNDVKIQVFYSRLVCVLYNVKYCYKVDQWFLNCV